MGGLGREGEGRGSSGDRREKISEVVISISPLSLLLGFMSASMNVLVHRRGGNHTLKYIGTNLVKCMGGGGELGLYSG